MKTSRLNYKFNVEEVVEQLRPYVTEINETKRLGFEHTFTGFYKGKPVFQVTDKKHSYTSLGFSRILSYRY